MKNKNVIIVGGGHAGIEAACAVSRIGLNALLITMDSSAIGRMSCNPAIGGLGKGHLVKEIDVLGGIMGRAADACGIQFKTLNKSKGRAVWSPRAQIDKKAYTAYIQNFIKKQQNISVIDGEVVDIYVNNRVFRGVKLGDGSTLEAGAIIICSGTFMNGKIHIGKKNYMAGRIGEKPTSGITKSLSDMGFTFSRLKTGTPPRLLSSSIDWSKLTAVFGDKKPAPFSTQTPRPFRPTQEPCFIVDTNIKAHNILINNLKKSAIYSGLIDGVGPRYCPSIEDKVVRFSDKNKHQLFLEPEWKNSNQIYVNGFSTSMPQSVQEKSLKKISGLENIEFIRYGYAIEYDYFPTYQLKNTLETKQISGLYFAGQLNGTSGYEEAAAQGLIAGANAALKLLQKEALALSRSEAYIGVLIDDLITKTINEPYRMFTSSAEHRLLLRPDNVIQRLSRRALSSGLITSSLAEKHTMFSTNVNKILQLCTKQSLVFNKKKMSIKSFLKMPPNTFDDKNVPKNTICHFSEEELFAAETEIKYEGYVKIESQRIDKLKKMESIKIPTSIDYKKIKNISSESAEKLTITKPQTLGQAARVAGVRPSDVAVLAVFLGPPGT